MISSEKLIKFSFLLEQERYNVQMIPILQQIKYERYWNKIRVRICWVVGENEISTNLNLS